MRVIAFAGPSLPDADRALYPGVDWRAPAEAGDLLRLEAGPGLTVCLIDGYFDHRPAVRHKELLWVLAAGARVLGASSIGALRAAEMDGFGMIGVGAIYRAFRRGTLVGDDEVALVHAAADWGWRPLSVPLVDVRATLCAAVRGRVVSARSARAILSAAAGIHYVDRDWPAVLARCDAGGSGFAAWVESGAVARKRLDANACMAAALGEPGLRAKPASFVRTAFVDALAKELAIDLGPATN